MSNALAKPWTTARFVLWEERQEGRHEFDGRDHRAMAGGTEAHAAIQRTLIAALTIGLRGTRCRPYGSELKIAVAAGSIRYADAFVVCSPVPPRSTVVADPVVVFEVLSDSSSNSSATIDIVVKNAEYRATPSIQRYVVLQQTRPAAIVFVRKGEDWVTELATGADASLFIPEIALTLGLADLYDGVGFEDES